MSARENLNTIVARSLALAPVEYTVRVPGVVAVQLNYLAIKSKRPVEAIICDAVEDYCFIEMLLEEQPS